MEKTISAAVFLCVCSSLCTCMRVSGNICMYLSKLKENLVPVHGC